MSVSDKVTLSGPGAYIASLERESAALRASRDALQTAIEEAIASIDSGMVEGAADTLRAAVEQKQ
jgi:hypothetical protein